MGSRYFGAAFAALLLVSIAPDRSAGDAMRPETGRIVATYSAALAGMSLGDVQVAATFDGSAYEMAADGQFSLLAGLLYRGSGKTTSRGKLTDVAPQPANFTLDYTGGKQRQQLRISFAGSAVDDVSIHPPKKPSPRSVPISAAQLKDVLDPLTAAFLSVRSDTPAGNLEVCRQTIPVFDGRQRFDIAMTPKRSEDLGRRAPKGVSGPAAVCRVRYQPIGGHRPDHPGVQYMTKTDAIEAWLVPVPRAGFYVPYKIVVPTAWGNGTLTLTGITATVAERERAEVP